MRIIDVYKRQVLARLLDASDYGMVGMLTIFSAIAAALPAVSSTHLDVYKRQGIDTAAHRGYATPLVGQGTDVGDIQTGIQQIVRIQLPRLPLIMEDAIGSRCV